MYILNLNIISELKRAKKINNFYHFPEKKIFLSVFVMVKFVCGIIQFLVKLLWVYITSLFVTILKATTYLKRLEEALTI